MKLNIKSIKTDTFKDYEIHRMSREVFADTIQILILTIEGENKLEPKNKYGFVQITDTLFYVLVDIQNEFSKVISINL